MPPAETHPAKKRGRPFKGGRDPIIAVRLPRHVLAALKALSAAEGATRSDRIRQLIVKHLKAKGYLK